MSDSGSAYIIGIVTTCGRPQLVRRLLESLKDAGPLHGIILNDNGSSDETEAVCKASAIPVEYHRPDHNLGCGGGIGRALSIGLRDGKATHFCIFDDDAEGTPGAVATLVQKMTAANADIAVPLIVGSEGYVQWVPGLTERRAWNAIRKPHLRPEQFRAECGPEPARFSWAPWPILALTAKVVRDCGFPREDFWMYVEDLEYTLRLTYRHRGVLVPEAVCRHLPPALTGGEELGGSHYLRFCLLLQNLSYICTRLPHARRILRHLPGNYLRFLRTFGVNPTSLRDAWLAWWQGAMRGHPAGIPGCDRFKQRLLRISN